MSDTTSACPPAPQMTALGVSLLMNLKEVGYALDSKGHGKNWRPSWAENFQRAPVEFYRVRHEGANNVQEQYLDSPNLIDLTPRKLPILSLRDVQRVRTRN